jgi:hypothetical protein
MIDAHFEFSLPNRKWKTLFEKSGKTPFPHKFWELNVYRDNVILGFRFQFSTQTDHAGLFTSITLFRFTIDFEFYDCRHWDDEENCWVDEK